VIVLQETLTAQVLILQKANAAALQEMGIAKHAATLQIALAFVDTAEEELLALGAARIRMEQTLRMNAQEISAFAMVQEAAKLWKRILHHAIQEAQEANMRVPSGIQEEHQAAHAEEDATQQAEWIIIAGQLKDASHTAWTL